MTSEDESDALHPPSAQRVASRALALTAVAYRAIVEQTATTDVAERARVTLRDWLESLGVAGELEPQERELVDTSAGSVGRQQLIDASWRSEGMVVLAWALQKSELPGADAQVDPAAIAQALGFLGPMDGTALSSPQLRSSAEIEMYALRAVSIHWRLREFSLRRQAIDFKKTAESAWFPLTTEGIALVEGDLAIRGVPLSRAPEAQWLLAMSIARERHQAADWLIGNDPVYSEVDTST